MNRSAAQLRKKHRKILAWSLVVAIAAHVALFTLAPEFEAKLIGDAPNAVERVGPAPRNPWVLDVRFGPPTLMASDGTPWLEPPDRVLEAVRVIDYQPECAGRVGLDGDRLTGSVRLRLNAEGYAAVVDIVEGTGTECGDRLLAGVAGDLHYHWLPNARFPAPLDLVQPVSLEAY